MRPFGNLDLYWTAYGRAKYETANFEVFRFRVRDADRGHLDVRRARGAAAVAHCRDDDRSTGRHSASLEPDVDARRPQRRLRMGSRGRIEGVLRRPIARPPPPPPPRLRPP